MFTVPTPKMRPSRRASNVSAFSPHLCSYRHVLTPPLCPSRRRHARTAAAAAVASFPGTPRASFTAHFFAID
jgi:hypothetical protein